MNKAQRDIYRELIALPPGGYGLCNVCRFAEWKGDCECADLTCHCGIEKVEEQAEDIWQGGDCWAFRPAWSLEDTADLVGIFLQGAVPDMSRCETFIPKRMRVLEVVHA